MKIDDVDTKAVAVPPKRQTKLTRTRETCVDIMDEWM